MQLRNYQKEIFDLLTSSNTHDIVQLDTGAGKTPIEAALAAWAPRTLLVAHRNILITQISEKLAAFGLEHDTVSTEHTRRMCIAAHRKLGTSYIARGHETRLVASMQSIVAAVRRGGMSGITRHQWLIVIDEAHHIVPDNMWGLLRTLFPTSRIVGFTATPARMDGESLHVDKGGVFERLVQAPSLANNSTGTLIDLGYLSGFRAHEARASFKAVGRGGGLDWDRGELELAGDPVEEYLRLAPGKRAILMAPAIRNAKQFAKDFRARGVPAACISSMQSPSDISRLLGDFRAGLIHVLTNVDMVGEGFDLPACEALIIATRTASFPRYRQWCGRVLRTHPSKTASLIIDLTGMCALHGSPDEPVEWDLLNPPCGPKTRRHVTCDDCGMYFLFKLENCPGCGAPNAWLDRDSSFAPGSFLFDIKMIDQSYRGIVIRERVQAREAAQMQQELIRPPNGFGAGPVGRALNALAAWFPTALKDAGVPIVDINRFLVSSDARDTTFYTRNFVRADVDGSNRKAVKVYRQWLKQQ